MGLDMVEFVMEVEETFDIQIADDDYGAIRTVGDLHDYIVKRMDRSDVPEHHRDRTCLTLATFLRIRRALVSQFGLPRSSVRPSSNLDEILPRNDRRRVWKQLPNVLNLNLPSLQRPPWMVWTLVAIIIILSAFALRLELMPVLGVLLMGIAGAAGVAVLTSPFLTLPGPEFATIGGLTRVVLQRNFSALYEQSHGWDPSAVWAMLQVIFVDGFGVKPEEVTRDAGIVDDLGLN